MRIRPIVAALTTFLIAACDRAAEQSGSVPADQTVPDIAPAPPTTASGAARGRPGVLGRSADLAVEAPKDIAEGRPASAVRPGTLPQVSTQSISTASMVIRTGVAIVEVDSLDRAVAAIRGLAASLGGYVADVAVQGGRDQQRSATIQVRIPSARFDDAVGGLAPLGRIESVNVTAEDVGEEYVDVSARVANARRLEERLIALLATRTGKLQDVLEVERELARVREEIERYEGRMRFLRSRTAVSSLAITVHERVPVVAGYRSTRVLANAFGEAWRNFIGFLAGFIALLGVLIPLGLIGAAIVFVISRAWRAGATGGLRRGAPALGGTQTEP
jgi:hypothetical protein